MKGIAENSEGKSEAKMLRSFKYNNKNVIALWPIIGISGGTSIIHNVYMDVYFDKIKINVYLYK